MTNTYSGLEINLWGVQTPEVAGKSVWDTCRACQYNFL